MRALKCTILFFSASLVHGITGDVVRAWAAARGGMPNTLYHFFILYDTDIPTPDPRLVASSALAPLVASAALGLAAAWTYTRARSAAVRLFTLYLGTFGAIGVLAPLAFAPWSGNLHDVLVWLDVPFAMSVGLAGVTALVLLVLLWEAGRRAQPPVGALVVPFVVGTLARLLVLAPVPTITIINMAGGSVYWLVAISGAAWQRRTVRSAGAAPLPPVRLAFSAMTLPVLLTLILRWMAMGIRFGP